MELNDEGQPSGDAAKAPTGVAPAAFGIPQLTELRELAIWLSESAGELIRQTHPNRVQVQDTKSSATDPVTEMDLRIESYLVNQIRQRRPDDGILGEEGDSRIGTTGLTWVIDPIDGTVNYLYGVASFAVSVAVVTGPPHPLHWTQQAGAVHDVVLNRTWAAARGLGATVNGQPIENAHLTPAPLAKSLVATGFGYAPNRRAGQARVLTQVLPQVRDIRRLGSAAIDLCLQAEGIVDLYYERGLQPWDLAAGTLIAAEAGSLVTGLRGLPASELMTVAGRGEAVRELIEILEQADADNPAE